MQDDRWDEGVVGCMDGCVDVCCRALSEIRTEIEKRVQTVQRMPALITNSGDRWLGLASALSPSAGALFTTGMHAFTRSLLSSPTTQAKQKKNSIASSPPPPRTNEHGIPTQSKATATAPAGTEDDTQSCRSSLDSPLSPRPRLSLLCRQGGRPFFLLQ